VTYIADKEVRDIGMGWAREVRLGGGLARMGECGTMKLWSYDSGDCGS
jgi:hypothetical protein